MNDQTNKSDYYVVHDNNDNAISFIRVGSSYHRVIAGRADIEFFRGTSFNFNLAYAYQLVATHPSAPAVEYWMKTVGPLVHQRLELNLKKARRLTPEQRDKVILMRNNGVSPTVIASHVGLSRRQVYNIAPNETLGH